MSTVADETGLLPFSAHIRRRIQYVTEKIPPNSHYFADKRHGFRAEPVEHDSRVRCHEQRVLSGRGCVPCKVFPLTMNGLRRLTMVSEGWKSVSLICRW